MSRQIDRGAQYLISNGDVSAVTNQAIYEYAWDQGVRSVREDRLKPERFTQRHGTARSGGKLFESGVGAALSNPEACR